MPRTPSLHRAGSALRAPSEGKISSLVAVAEVKRLGVSSRIVKLTVLFPLLLLASAQLEAAPDIDLKSRPAQILSIDRESGFAKFRIEAKSRSARARPREVELMISYKNEWSARVVRIIAPNRKRPGTLDDLKPGMSVLVTGLDAISIRIANEITIDERKTAQ